MVVIKFLGALLLGIAVVVFIAIQIIRDEANQDKW